MPEQFCSAWLRQFFHLCFISFACIQVPWGNGFRSRKSSTSEPQIISQCKKYSFHCWNWKSCGFDLFFPDKHLVNVLSSGSVRSHSWSFPVETEISCVCVSCLTSRGLGFTEGCDNYGALQFVNQQFPTWLEHAGLQVGEIYSLLEVLTLTLTSLSGQEFSHVPSLQSLGHDMQRGSLRSSSSSWNLTVCMDPRAAMTQG